MVTSACKKLCNTTISLLKFWKSHKFGRLSSCLIMKQSLHLISCKLIREESILQHNSDISKLLVKLVDTDFLKLLTKIPYAMERSSVFFRQWGALEKISDTHEGVACNRFRIRIFNTCKQRLKRKSQHSLTHITHLAWIWSPFSLNCCDIINNQQT